MVAMPEVHQQYRDGVAAFVRTAEELGDDDWANPACGKWSAEELARHLLAVARWYHHWLDRAISGETERPFHSDDIDARNDAELVQLTDRSGPDAAAEFETVALAYLERTADHWDVTFPYPYGVVTTGLHCALAASEWHIHTWDLATSQGGTHVPADAAGLFRAAAAAEAARHGGTRGRFVRLLAPLGSRLRPWEAMLRWSGRIRPAGSGRR